MLRQLRSRLSVLLSRKRRPDLSDVDRTSGLPISRDVETFRQGDVLDIPSLVVEWNTQGRVPCPDGVVIVSQTCDVVRTSSAEVQAAPVVSLSRNEASNVKSGRQPRYARLDVDGQE